MAPAELEALLLTHPDILDAAVIPYFILIYQNFVKLWSYFWSQLILKMHTYSDECRYPDNEAGQIPMAYLVRKDGGNITEKTVMAFIARQVPNCSRLYRTSRV